MQCLTPKSMAELSGALAQATPATRILAGGTDYVLHERKGGLTPDLLIYPGAIPELRQISLTEDGLTIGAMVTMREIADALSSVPAYRAIADMAANVGSPQIRNKATLVGNLANASPAGDSLPVCLLYQAQVLVMDGSGDVAVIPAGEFVLGPQKTVLSAGQAIVAIRFPRSFAPGTISAFSKVGFRQHVSIARESMGALVHLTDEGVISEVRITLGAVSSAPIEIPEVCEMMVGQRLDDEALFERVSSAVAQAVQSHCRPANRLYKTEAAKGLTADVFSLLLSRSHSA